MTPFEKACAAAQGVTKLAERMTALTGEPYSQNRLSNWKKTGVPAECVLLVCQAVDFAVTPHELAGSIYPHPHDGLPAERRAAA